MTKMDKWHMSILFIVKKRTTALVFQQREIWIIRKAYFLVKASFPEVISRIWDVVPFDTTYMTNKYDLIFGAFTGVNQHVQSVLFGCGPISNENFETFVWLFTKWLEAMPAIAPKTFINDQDPAMTRPSNMLCQAHVIDIVFGILSKSFHRNYAALPSSMKFF